MKIRVNNVILKEKQGKNVMYKIRKIKFQEHPILRNLELDFCGKDGKALDTIIFSGENGTGKSTIFKGKASGYHNAMFRQRDEICG